MTMPDQCPFPRRLKTTAPWAFFCGYDAVQLATALVANTSVIARGFQPLALVSADKELLAAALAIGLNTVDVRQYR